MKKTFLMMTLMLFALMGRAQSVSVFITDNDRYTNVRNSPNGKVVARIDNNLGSGMLELEKPVNGWWRIEDNSWEIAEEAKEVTLRGSRTGYWIHYSVVGFGTRNYGGQKLTLRATPSVKGRAVYSFTKELILHPLEVKGEWIKVKTNDGHIGWIHEEWICDNPLTNCC